MKRAALAAVAVAAVVALGLVVHAAVSSGPTAEAAPTSAPTTATSATPEAEQTAQFLPKPDDFTTTIRPLVTTCGLTIRPAPELADQSVAHCKITYRTAVTHHGKPLDPERHLHRAVRGDGHRERQRAVLVTISGTHVTGVPVRTAVPSPGVKLAAVANDVEWLP